MNESYRVINGRKARGVSKRFSEEELRKRGDRLRSVQHLSVASKIRKAVASKARKAELKRQVKAAAEVGVFVPVQDWE